MARVMLSPARMNAIQARSSSGASLRFFRVVGIGCVVNELIVSSTNGAQERREEAHTMVWYIDPYHTQATFSVKHMMVSTVRGRLGKLRGEIDIDPKNPHRASFEIAADVTAIDTGDPRRDGHLRSA